MNSRDVIKTDEIWENMSLQFYQFADNLSQFPSEGTLSSDSCMDNLWSGRGCLMAHSKLYDNEKGLLDSEQCLPRYTKQVIS